MATPTLSWAEFWSLYRSCPVQTQQDILAQLDMPTVLKFASIKAKKEILAEAPPEVWPSNPYLEMGKDELLKAIFGKRR